MPSHTLTDAAMAAAVDDLCRVEPRFAAVAGHHGVPSLRAMPPGLESLLHIVTEQFLSLKAAHVIWMRLSAELAPFGPQSVLDCSHVRLMQLGLSGAKARSFHGIASAVKDNPSLFDEIAAADDIMARKSLLTLPGVGPWTADIYLLSALLRRDVWPWGDLALRHAAADLFSLPGLPDPKSMRQLGEGFAPWRAVAARLLWAHYRGLKGLAQAK